MLPECLKSFGNYYADIGEPATALQYYMRAVNTCKGSHNAGVLPDILLNIAAIYYNRHQYTSALYYARQSLKGYKAQEKRVGMAISLRTLAEIFIKTGNFKRSSQLIAIAEKLAIST